MKRINLFKHRFLIIFFIAIVIKIHPLHSGYSIIGISKDLNYIAIKNSFGNEAGYYEFILIQDTKSNKIIKTFKTTVDGDDKDFAKSKLGGKTREQRIQEERNNADKYFIEKDISK